MGNKRIAILMSTYNGGRFLRDQLDSIIAQNNHDWHLYIHDDQSNDGTKYVLDEYAKKNQDQITVLNYPSTGGACRNFMSLLKKVEADYYMFSDQDDKWHEDKVQAMIDRMYAVEKKFKNKPVVVNCDLRVVDENMKVLHTSFFSYSNICPSKVISFPDYVQNVVTGCAMLFNNEARESALAYDSKYILMHDSWVMLRTIADGGVRETIYKPLVDYRQHSSNVLGAQDGHRFTFRYRLCHFFEMLSKNVAHYKMMKAAGNISILVYIKAKVNMYFKLKTKNKVLYNIKK